MIRIVKAKPINWVARSAPACTFEVSRKQINTKLTHFQIFAKLRRLQVAFYSKVVRLPIIKALLLNVLEEEHSDNLSGFSIMDRGLIRLCYDDESDLHNGGGDCDVCEYETCKKTNQTYQAESEYLANWFLFSSCSCKRCLLRWMLAKLLICESKCIANWQTKVLTVLFKTNIDYKFVLLARVVVLILKRKWLFSTLDCVCIFKTLSLLEWVIACESRIRYYKRLIVNSSKWLAAWVVKTCFQYSLNKPELIRAGMLALLISVNRFDFCSGFKFSTYARWWVKHRMLKMCSSTAAVRAPKTSIVRIRNVGDNKTIISVTKTDRYRMVSLDKAIDDDCNLHAIVAYDNTSSNSKTYSDAVQSFEVLKRLVLLTPREERVLRRRSLADNSDWNLAKIGRELSLCRERVRQIELSAAAKLRAFDDMCVDDYYDY
ncbi:MAG: sigma-70 family RNA polymerase sigma factor [Candidatus Hodgkinia cicadicola]